MATRSPYSPATRSHHWGSSSAAVPMLTRAAPVASARRNDSSSRIPPESSTSPASRRTTPASSSAFDPRPKAASRSTRCTHSAPSFCQASAASSGSPYAVSEPAAPCTRRTAWPSATSTAGSRVSVTSLSGGLGAAAEDQDDEGRHRDNDHGGQDDAQRQVGHEQPDHGDGQQRHHGDADPLAAAAPMQPAGLAGRRRQPSDQRASALPARDPAGAGGLLPLQH